MKLKKSTATLCAPSPNGMFIEFDVWHNLPKTPGLNLMDAIDSWIFQTKKHTAKSLSKYIMKKNVGYVCMTEKQYKKQLKSA